MGATKSQQLEYYDSAAVHVQALHEMRVAWQYRDFIVHLIKRDITTRYKRSILGIAWTMLNPLGMMLVLSVAFSQIFHSIASYPVFLFPGLIAWTFFSQTTMAALNTFLWGGALMQKIYIPRTAYALSAIGTGLINLCISLVPLLALALILDVPIRISILFLPFSILLLSLFSLGLTLIIARFGVIYRDVADMFQIVLAAWFYLTPVLYNADAINGQLARVLQYLNPMWSLVSLFRDPIYNGHLPSLQNFGIAAAWSLTTAALGWITFTRKANDLVYRL